MALKFLSDIDVSGALELNGNLLKNARLQNASSNPSGPSAGQIYYNSSDNEIRFYNGTSWINLSSATGDITGVTAGNGLTGGGTSGAVTLNVVGGTGITANANDVAVTAAQTAITSLINSSLTKIGTATDQEYIKFDTSNEVNVHINDSEKLSVTAAGANVTGDFAASATSSAAHILVTGIISGSQIEASGDVIAFSSSDRRFKDNLVVIEGSLDKIGKINGYEFDWNDKQTAYKGHDIGVVAQEIEAVLPEVVTTRGDGYKAVKYDKIVPLLIESIKELQKKVEDIEKNCDCLNK